MNFFIFGGIDNWSERGKEGERGRERERERESERERERWEYGFVLCLDEKSVNFYIKMLLRGKESVISTTE